jgi:two-component system, chemotaxis family, protein-glutamate methylesterase/glutaminase
MVRVLVVEDSPVVRDFLAHILNLAPDVQVVGMAHDGEHGIAMVSDCRPDVVTMEIHMPKMDGFEATRRIMETQPVPIVIVSGSSTVLEAVTACRALGAGAVAVEARPYGCGHPDFARSAEKFVETVRLMAGVKVIKRWPRLGGEAGEARPVTPMPARSDIRVVAIGASTGGPGGNCDHSGDAAEGSALPGAHRATHLRWFHGRIRRMAVPGVRVAGAYRR